MKENRFSEGIKDGMPIAFGYLSVSFSFGIIAVNGGLTWWEALLISMTNLTSAGQVAGLSVMIASGSMLEMALTQLVINLRYSLMSISLSQKVDQSISGIFRWILAFGHTDEIYAVAMGKEKQCSRSYMFGLITAPYFGWTIGTLTGAVLGDVLPEFISSALGIAIYGMFIAIFVPPMKQEKSVFFVVMGAIAMSCMFKWVPVMKAVPNGFAIIICAVVCSLAGAFFFPLPNEDTGTEAEECDKNISRKEEA